MEVPGGATYLTGSFLLVLLPRFVALVSACHFYLLFFLSLGFRAWFFFFFFPLFAERDMERGKERAAEGFFEGDWGRKREVKTVGVRS